MFVNFWKLIIFTDFEFFIMSPVDERSNTQKAENNCIIFDTSKKEALSPTNGLKVFTRRLKAGWKVVSNKDPITPENLAIAKLLVLASPKEKFTTAEIEAMKKYIENGGSIFVMMGEGGELKSQTNVNVLLEQFGMEVQSDVVLRSHYYKYFHPKEALVSNGVINRAISQVTGKWSGDIDDDSNHTLALTFVYPFGATLNTTKQAIVLLSTGGVCYPLNRPVCAFSQPKGIKGKIIVVGSVSMFSDQYLEKEENSKILDALITLLTTDDIKLNQIDAENPEISDYNLLPNIGTMAEQPKSCLQETEELPRDITTLFDNSLFNLDTSLMPKVIKAYEQLKVAHEPLTLITPQFETPLPPLQPAVFPPTFREPAAPLLDLFDLDEHFTSQKGRLAQLTNKCTDNDLEYYVRECGDILGISSKLPPNKRSAKDVLEYVLYRIVEFKKVQ